MVDYALKAGVRGWVRNSLDGSVEAILADHADAVGIAEWPVPRQADFPFLYTVIQH